MRIILALALALALGGCAPANAPARTVGQQWEIVGSTATAKDCNTLHTERLAVPGGWLYRTWIDSPRTWDIAIAQSFVPDSTKPERNNQ
jgi:hypothetical protein